MAQLWDEAFAVRVGAEVARVRREQGLSAAQLSARTADLGHPLSRSLIADLEVGRRGPRLQVTEVLVLAAALGTSPIELLFSALPGGDVDVLPGMTVTSWQGLQWFSGESGLAEDGPRWFLSALRRQTALVQEWQDLTDDVARLGLAGPQETDGPVPPASAALLATMGERTRAVVTELRRVREDVRERGRDPGALEMDLAFVDDLHAWRSWPNGGRE